MRSASMIGCLSAMAPVTLRGRLTTERSRKTSLERNRKNGDAEII